MKRDDLCDLARDLQTANRRLSEAEAVGYARRIRAAESREKYIEMYRVIQEALYMEGAKNAA